MDNNMATATKDTDDGPAKRQRSSPGNTSTKNKKPKTYTSTSTQQESTDDVDGDPMDTSSPMTVAGPNEVTQSKASSPTKRNTILHGAFVDSSSDDDTVAAEQDTPKSANKATEPVAAQKEKDNNKEKQIKPTGGRYGWGGWSDSNAAQLTRDSVRRKSTSKSSSEKSAPLDSASNTTRSESPPQTDDTVFFKKPKRPKFRRKNFASVNDNDNEASAALGGGEVPTQDPVPGVPAGDPRRAFQSYYPAPNLPEVTTPQAQAQLTIKIVPEDASAVYEQLAGRTLAGRALAVHLNDDFIVHAQETPYKRKASQDVRMDTTDSITDYLRDNVGVRKEILSQRVASAQAARIKPENKSKIQQMKDEADRKLANLPPYAPSMSSDNRDNNKAASKSARRVSFAEPSEPPTPKLPTPVWNKVQELVQKGSSTELKPKKAQKDTQLRELSSHKLMPYTLTPLMPQDFRRPSVADVALKVIEQSSTSIPEEMKSANIVYRHKDQKAYLKICKGAREHNRLIVTSDPPLTHLAQARASAIAAAEDEHAKQAEQGEDDMIILPTVSASSRCRSKKSKMVPVYVLEDEDVEMGVPQYDGASDASYNTGHDELGKSEVTGEEQGALVNMGQPFRPVGATTSDGIPQTATFSPLPLADSDGNIIKKDDGGTSDNDEMLDYAGAKDEDQTAKQTYGDPAYPMTDLELDIHHAMEHQVKRQVNKILHDFDEQNTYIAPNRMNVHAVLNKENDHLTQQAARRDPSLHALTKLVVEEDWQDADTLSDLQKEVTKAFPPPPKRRSPMVECGDCGRRNHKMENCKPKYRENPADGFLPAARIAQQSLKEKRVMDSVPVAKRPRRYIADIAFPGLDGPDERPLDQEDHNMNDVSDKDKTIEHSEKIGSTPPTESSRASLPPAGKFRTLSRPDDLPEPASEAAFSRRGGESPASKRVATMDTPQRSDLSKGLSDADIEMADASELDASELPFPSLDDTHQADAREDSAEYGDLMDQVEDQVDAQLRSELEKSDDATDRTQTPQEQANSGKDFLAVGALGVMDQTTIMVSVDTYKSAQASSQAFSSTQMMRTTSLRNRPQEVEPTPMMVPPPPSSRQSSKAPSSSGTPNPFRNRRASPDPIDAAGLEALSGIRSTPAPSSSRSVAFNPFRASNAAATPMNVDSDDEDDEPIKMTPLSAKAGKTRVSAAAKARGGDNGDGENIEDFEDDDYLPEAGAIKAKKKQTRTSKAARSDSDGEDELPYSPIVVKRNAKARQSLNAGKTEVPETPNIQQTGDKPLKSSLRKTSRSTADSRLVANQGSIPAEESKTDKGRGKRATSQSTGASESRSGTAAPSRSARKGASTSSRMKRAAKTAVRAEADDAEASEQDEEYSLAKSKRKDRGRSKVADSRDEDVVMESVEPGGRKSKCSQSTKRTARFKSPTPGAKSTTADPESKTVLCYNSKQTFLPVEIGDRVVRLFTKEDTKLYGKADEFDEFDGPWEVVDIRVRKKDKELIETVLEEGISEEMRKEAWKMLLTKVKLGIPEEAEKKDKVEPWIQLSQVLPVLDVEGIKEGRLGAAGIWIEALGSYKALKRRLGDAKDTGGSANVIKKMIAKAKDEDVESSFGVVNLRKNVFVAVVDKDPNWTQDDEYAVDKIRKKRLRMIWFGSANDEEKDQQDIDKWQGILKAKTGDALRHYVILVQWWVQWAGWPIESSTWEPRASFNDGGSTLIVDHYNKNLDIFRDTPIDGVTYSLDHLFDHEDDQIEKCRSAMAKYQLEKKFPSTQRKPRTKKVEEDPEKKAREAAAKKKLADMLFNDEADEAIAKAPKVCPQIDDPRSPGPSRREKEAVEDDWEQDLFGEHIESPAKSQTQTAPVAQMQMMQPGEELDIFGDDPSTPTQDREMTYSPPPMSNERIAGRGESFRTHDTPEKKMKKPEEFHPLYDVSPGAERRASPKTGTTSNSDAKSGTQIKVSNTPVKASASQLDRDGDVAMATGTPPAGQGSNEVSNDVAMTEAGDLEPAVERAQTVEVVEQLVEERLFIQQDPIEPRDTVAQHLEMNAQMSAGPNGEVKVEVTEGDAQPPVFRY